MKEEQWTKEHESAAFKEFWMWKKVQETEPEEKEEDWRVWRTFLSGYRVALGLLGVSLTGS